MFFQAARGVEQGGFEQVVVAGFGKKRAEGMLRDNGLGDYVTKPIKSAESIRAASGRPSISSASRRVR